MKKIITIFLIVLFLVCFVGCSDNTVSEQSENTNTVSEQTDTTDETSEQTEVKESISITDITGYYKFRKGTDGDTVFNVGDKIDDMTLSKETYVFKIYENKSFKIYVCGLVMASGEISLDNDIISLASYSINGELYSPAVDIKNFQYDNLNKVINITVYDGETIIGLELEKDDNFELFDKKVIGEYGFNSMQIGDTTYCVGDNLGDDKLKTTTSYILFNQDGEMVIGGDNMNNEQQTMFWYSCDDKVVIPNMNQKKIDDIFQTIEIIDDKFTVNYGEYEIVYKKCDNSKIDKSLIIGQYSFYSYQENEELYNVGDMFVDDFYLTKEWAIVNIKSDNTFEALAAGEKLVGSGVWDVKFESVVFSMNDDDESIFGEDAEFYFDIEEGKLLVDNYGDICCFVRDDNIILHNPSFIGDYELYQIIDDGTTYNLGEIYESELLSRESMELSAREDTVVVKAYSNIILNGKWFGNDIISCYSGDDIKYQFEIIDDNTIKMLSDEPTRFCILCRSK